MLVWKMISMNYDGHETTHGTKEEIIEDESDSKEDGEPNQQQKGNYFRKQLACKQLVNSIDISLDKRKLRVNYM